MPVDLRGQRVHSVSVQSHDVPVAVDVRGQRVHGVSVQRDELSGARGVRQQCMCLQPTKRRDPNGLRRAARRPLPEHHLRHQRHL